MLPSTPQLLYVPRNQPAASVAASWTATDAAVDNAAGFITTKTFTARAIGTASATRQVLVGMACKNDAGGSPTTYTATIGGVSATSRGAGESTPGGGVDVALFQANVPTGTTADVVITCGSAGGIAQIAIAVGVLDGVTAAPSSSATAGAYAASQNSPYATGSSITVPSGGYGIGVAGVSSAPGTPGWNNITADATATVAGTNVAITMGHISTAGAITPSAVFGNFAQEVTLAAAWGP